jgi:serine/threonine protein kinase/Flp pilus assembly protein TadD
MGIQPGTRLGPYEVLSAIGAGGMGEVYKARDTRLDRIVAIKVLLQHLADRPDVRERFDREARTIASLNHPHICVLYDVGHQDGVDYLVMEYLEGETLLQHLWKGPLPLEEVLQYASEIADAIDKAHSRNVVHRDLKPGNIMLTKSGTKLLDFGLAKLKQEATPPAVPLSQLPTLTNLPTAHGAVLGTLQYMAPEQLEGKEVDARTDIFAFGAVVYEMATGKKAFEGASQASLISSILTSTPPPISTLQPMTPPALDRVIRKCLAKDPEKRWQTASDLTDELKWIARGGSGSRSTELPETKRAKRNWPKPVAAAAAILALVSLLAVFDPGGWRERVLGGARPGQIQTLAVLPLENLSGDPQQEYFADGMTEALITSLAKISALKVISRTSVMPFKGARKSLREIAQALHADAIVEGSVVTSGQQVRITAQLIEAQTDQHLWADSYERNRRDILALQDEVARTISRQIRISVTPQERARLTTAREINPQAHEAYLKGLYYSGIPAQRPKAVESFQQAIQEDPGYAAPYAGLADLYFARAFFDNSSPKDTYPAMREAASKALERDETLPLAHADMALVKLHADWDWAGADQEFRRALDLNPSDAGVRHTYAHFLMAMGREKESQAESERAVELDPVDVGLTACLGWHDVWGSQYEDAIQQTLEALQMNPSYVWAKINLGWAYEQKSMFEEAIAEFQASVSNPGMGTLAMANLAHAYAVSGKTREARGVLAKLKERAEKNYISPYQLAAVYAGLGDKQQAFEWLEKGYAERSTWMVYMKWDPRFANLRSDPRFQDLVRRIGLPS